MAVAYDQLAKDIYDIVGTHNPDMYDSAGEKIIELGNIGQARKFIWANEHQVEIEPHPEQEDNVHLVLHVGANTPIDQFQKMFGQRFNQLASKAEGVELVVREKKKKSQKNMDGSTRSSYQKVA